MSEESSSFNHLWTGTPVYRVSSRCSDESYRVFHRDFPGRVIVKFVGDNAKSDAELFCKLFGEADGSEEVELDLSDDRMT